MYTWLIWHCWMKTCVRLWCSFFREGHLKPSQAQSKALQRAPSARSKRDKSEAGIIRQLQDISSLIFLGHALLQSPSSLQTPVRRMQIHIQNNTFASALCSLIVSLGACCSWRFLCKPEWVHFQNICSVKCHIHGRLVQVSSEEVRDALIVGQAHEVLLPRERRGQRWTVSVFRGRLEGVGHHWWVLGQLGLWVWQTIDSITTVSIFWKDNGEVGKETWGREHERWQFKSPQQKWRQYFIDFVCMCVCGRSYPFSVETI